MHPPETSKAVDNMDSFQFIGWFVPVGDSMVSQIHDDAEERRDRGHALRSGRRRWGENGETRPIAAAQVPVLRGAQRQCEANGPDGEGEFTMGALCAPSAVAKALASLVGGYFESDWPTQNQTVFVDNH